MLLNLFTVWLAMAASLMAFFGLYGSLQAKTLGEVAIPILSTGLMSVFAYFMWTLTLVT